MCKWQSKRKGESVSGKRERGGECELEERGGGGVSGKERGGECEWGGMRGV